ncbi:MAG TPA: RNA polymerase sigma factor [Bacillota bacterium]|nr:RNA polymerase sigma factor [Bacillota bacterium]
MKNECPKHDCSVPGQDISVSLLKRFRSGDDSALEEIVALYHDGLLYFINGYVHNITVAEDVLSDTFLKLITSIGKFRQDASLKTYLYKIAANRSIDELRRIERHGTVDLDNIEETPGDEETLEHSLISDERSRILHSAMEKLRCDYKRVLFLLYFEGMDVQCAARVLRKSKKQTENLVFRAKRSLKTILERDGYDYENFR